jgi:hypothetical protein
MDVEKIVRKKIEILRTHSVFVEKMRVEYRKAKVKGSG